MGQRIDITKEDELESFYFTNYKLQAEIRGFLDTPRKGAIDDRVRVEGDDS